MADEGQKERDKLFRNHKERKQKQKEEEELKQSKENASRDRTIELINTTIIPVLKRLTKEIEAQGYQAEVVEMFEHSNYPLVGFRFTPIMKNTDPIHSLRHINPSKISFMYSGVGTIKVEREINTAQGKEYGGTELEQLEEKVTEKWIEIQLSRFIEAVLKAN